MVDPQDEIYINSKANEDRYDSYKAERNRQNLEEVVSDFIEMQ